jgi:hypothetical protein
MAKSSGGIGGSGVFGLIGTSVQCDADSKSTYCKFAKLMNILVWLLMLFFIGYFALNFLKKRK